MAGDERELAEDCWMAITILRHPSCHDVELPEWLASAASHLATHRLPSVQV
jgi:hypothetical protein